MKFSKATDYALHTMLLMLKTSAHSPMTVIDLANAQNISPTYLSKILTKLCKAGLIKGNSGAKGGYLLRKDWQSISFLDIIQTIEGQTSIFDCYVHEDPDCSIRQIVSTAEARMDDYLKKQTLDQFL